MLPITEKSKITRSQHKFKVTSFERDGVGYTIKAELRFDDSCGNGHNTFSITGAITQNFKEIAGGCIHHEIAEHFPHLRKYIKWHLTSTDGPVHYVANTLYHAGDRDHNGKRKGEMLGSETHVQFGDNPIKHKLTRSFAKFLQDASTQGHPAGAFDFEVIAYEHGPSAGYQFKPKYTFGGYAQKWHECPFDTELEALDFLKALQTCNPHFVSVATSWGDGKARELDLARSSAVWPNATDSELSAEPAVLKTALEARLPALLAEFRSDMQELGFIW